MAIGAPGPLCSNHSIAVTTQQRSTISALALLTPRASELLRHLLVRRDDTRSLSVCQVEVFRRRAYTPYPHASDANHFYPRDPLAPEGSIARTITNPECVRCLPPPVPGMLPGIPATQTPRFRCRRYPHAYLADTPGNGRSNPPRWRDSYRRGGDSNPRDGNPPSGFRDHRLQPLGHLSPPLIIS